MTNLAEIWVHAHKNIVCIHASLCAGDILCAKTGLACSPGSIDAMIFLIRPNLADIWACAHKLLCLAQIMCSDKSGMFFCFHGYFDLSDSAQFDSYMGLSIIDYSVHAY